MIDVEVEALEGKILNAHRYDTDRPAWIDRRKAYLTIRRFITDEKEPTEQTSA
jgi:hypothetical protein